MPKESIKIPVKAKGKKKDNGDSDDVEMKGADVSDERKTGSEDENEAGPALSPEDQKLKESLELQVERSRDADGGVQVAALKMMGEAIRTATSSMTSVPKPLKFLRPHYDGMVEFYESGRVAAGTFFFFPIASAPQSFEAETTRPPSLLILLARWSPFCGSPTDQRATR